MSRSYITNVIETVEGLLLEDGKCEILIYNARNPLPSNYRPEIDITEELGTELLSRYLQLVGIFCWAIDLVKVNTFHKTFLLLQYQDNPRVGHLEALYYIFASLRIHIKMRRIGYDPMDPNFDLLVFNNNAYWKEFYGDVDE